MLRAGLATGRGANGDDAGVQRIYVTGHRNPDTDSVASAIGYAELRGRLDPRNEYVPARSASSTSRRGGCSSAAARPSRILPHIMLRVCDVMRTRFPLADHRDRSAASA